MKSNKITSEQKEELLNGLRFLLRDYNARDFIQLELPKKFSGYIDEISKGNKVV